MKLFDNKPKEEKVLIEEEQRYILRKDSPFIIREAYNKLRSNIMYSLPGKGCKVIAVTSTFAGEGKSINTLNIALSHAEIGKKVLLVDCDLRRPKVHRLIGVESAPGFSNLLVGECSFKDAVKHIEGVDIDILCSGSIPPNSTSLLESEALYEFLESVKGDYDYIFFDTPPVHIVIDCCIIAKYLNGVVFVIRDNFVKKEKLMAAVQQMEIAGGKVIGFILNSTGGKGMLFGGYGYKRGYRYNNYGYRYGYGRYGRYGGYGKYGYSYRRHRNEKKLDEAKGNSSKNGSVKDDIKVIDSSKGKSKGGLDAGNKK